MQEKTFNWHRAVIKVGSALIAPTGLQCSASYTLPISQFITTSLLAKKEVILVSSGSVAAGRNDIAIQHNPSVAEKQAMAAVGQTRMMANWQRFFDIPCAQILLTYDDLNNDTRLQNTRNTLEQLIKYGVLPIINENDTVATHELTLGDNDNLASYVAITAQADCLIICSDVDGLMTENPSFSSSAKLIEEVKRVDESHFERAGQANSLVGTGGMYTKLQAAQRASEHGIQTMIVNGTNTQTFSALSQNMRTGTYFYPQSLERNNNTE